MTFYIQADVQLMMSSGGCADFAMCQNIDRKYPDNIRAQILSTQPL
jgi:hypothetical protein